MSIFEQKIQHNSVPSELKPFVWCWLPSLCCCSMYLKHKVHTIMLDNSFQQQQGGTNHWWQVAWGTKFGAAVPWYCSVLSVELPSCHITGIWNFKVPSRFLETLCILEWHYSKSSLCHVTCILSKLIFKKPSEWYKIPVVIYVWKFTVFAIQGVTGGTDQTSGGCSLC